MIKFSDSSILFLLPEHLRKKNEVKALDYAINLQIKRLAAFLEEIKLYANIDGLSSEVLDALAIELQTPFYRSNLEIEVKRRLVKNSLQWMMTLGTPAAVEEVVRAVFGRGKIIEWDEYGGKPSHFKVITSASLSDVNIDYFNEVIKGVKNKRSKLDLVEVHRREDLRLFSGVTLGCYFIAPDIREGG